MSREYAKGNRAWGICGRSGKRALLKDLEFDGRYPNMRVLREWWEPRDPLEKLDRIEDPLTLWRPAPEDGPIPPFLTGRRGGGLASLHWTAADPRGGARFETYTLYRAVSVDDGLTFSDYTVVSIGTMVYDMFMAILVFPNEYEDTGIDPDLIYRYFVVAADSNGRGVNSNILQPEDNITLDAMDTHGTFLSGTLELAQFLTSRIYPIEIIEGLESGGDTHEVEQYAYREAMEGGGDVVDGEMRVGLLIYEDAAPEALETSSDFLSGAIDTVLVTYEDAAPEALSTSSDFLSGELRPGLQTYEMLPEALDISSDLLSGSLV